MTPGGLRAKAEAELRMNNGFHLSENNYRDLLDSLDDGVYLTDASRRILFWNRAATTITGYAAKEVLGSCCADSVLRHTDARGVGLCDGACPLARTLTDGIARAERINLQHRDGHRLPVLARITPIRAADGSISGAVEVFRREEPGDELRERIVELERLALLDPLTNLPNRRWLTQQIETRMDEFRRYQWPFGILMIDLDHFKAVNDAHGHEVGDKLLGVVAKSISAGTRLCDSIGRWGGEEFLAVVVNVEIGRLLPIADRMRVLVGTTELREPVRAGVTCSIGAAIVRPDDSIPELLRRADQALYRAKYGGRNQVCA
jgi:diguanylate cyclase (GGDEF)-like protein/PAS domain S-box-containing protein